MGSLLDFVKAQTEAAARTARADALNAVSSAGVRIGGGGPSSEFAVNEFSRSLVVPTVPFPLTARTLALFHCEDDTDEAGNASITPTPTSGSGGKFGNCWSGDDTYAIGGIPQSDTYLLIQFWVYLPSGGSVVIEKAESYSIAVDESGVTFTLTGIDSATLTETIAAETWTLITCQYGLGIILVGIDDLCTWVDASGAIADTDEDTELTLATGAKIDELRFVSQVMYHQDVRRRTCRGAPADWAVWNFAEGTGVTAYSALMPSSRHLDLTGGAWDADGFGFDGSAYGDVDGEIRAFTDFSLEVWAKFDTVADCWFVSQYNGFGLGYQSGNIVFEAGGATALSLAFTFEADVWYNICVQYDGDNVSLWIGGLKVAEDVLASLAMTSGPLTVGAYHDTTDGFQGVLSLVRICRGLLRPWYRNVEKFRIGAHGFTPSEDWLLG